MLEMNPVTFEAYWLAITRIEAQCALLQLKITVYPHLKKEDQEETYSWLKDLAYPEQKTYITPLEAIRIAHG